MRILFSPYDALIQSKRSIWNDVINQTKVVKFSSEHFLAMCSETEAKIYKLGAKCNEVEAWFTAKYHKTHFLIRLFAVYKIIKMGRRSINTTKSGKFMNPTDQASKFKHTWLLQTLYAIQSTFTIKTERVISF